MKSKLHFNTFLILFIILFGMLFSACKKQKTKLATSLEIISGNNQTGSIKSELEKPIEVIVKDQNGDVFKDETVNFAVTEGSVSSETVTTDIEGKANVMWTLGQTVGNQTLTISAFKQDGTTPLTGSPFSVNASANEPSSIELISGNNQTANIVTILTNPITVIVKDQNGDVFKGETVNFAVTEGSVSSETVITDTEGKANVVWTLGQTVGNQTLTISAFRHDGTTPLTGSPFSVNATATLITDYDGNTYNVIIIGNQTWLSENLNTTHYPNGTPIPLVEDGYEWGSLSNNDAAYCYYNNNANGEKEVYGALYTWVAAMGGDTVASYNTITQGVCPDGWHLPSYSEWEDLAEHLGGINIAGGKLKEEGTEHWYSPNVGATNESGFTALPGGRRFDTYDDGPFGWLHEITHFWTASSHGDYNSYLFTIYQNEERIHMPWGSRGYGQSVRCIQDNNN